MSLFSKLFGGGKDGAPSSADGTPETYKGFTIIPSPAKDSGGYRVGGRIEMGEGDDLKSHTFIRADTCGAVDEAERISVLKAKQIIDEQGARLFD